MTDDTAIVMLQIPKKHLTVDLEIPLTISADRIIDIIYSTYNVEPKASYIICENPITLIRGKKTMQQLGIRDGSIFKLL